MPTAADTETLTVRVSRGTAEELRRRAGGSGPELARLAGDLLDRSVAPDPTGPPRRGTGRPAPPGGRVRRDRRRNRHRVHRRPA